MSDLCDSANILIFTEHTEVIKNKLSASKITNSLTSQSTFISSTMLTKHTALLSFKTNLSAVLDSLPLTCINLEPWSNAYFPFQQYFKCLLLLSQFLFLLSKISYFCRIGTISVCSAYSMDFQRIPPFTPCFTLYVFTDHFPSSSLSKDSFY